MLEIASRADVLLYREKEKKNTFPGFNDTGHYSVNYIPKSICHLIPRDTYLVIPRNARTGTGCCCGVHTYSRSPSLNTPPLGDLVQVLPTEYTSWPTKLILLQQTSTSV